MAKKNPKIIASIEPLRLTNLKNNQYGGIAFINLVRHNEKNYLNIMFQPKYKAKNTWHNDDLYNAKLPISETAKMVNYIKHKYGIRYNRKNQGKAKFKVNDNADKKDEKDNLQSEDRKQEPDGV